MSQKMGGPEAAQDWAEAGHKPSELADVDEEHGSGGILTDLTREASMASPRLVLVPDSPPFSAQLPPNR